MSQTAGIVLATNNTGAAATAAQTWVGGKSALTISATTFPATCFLQVLSSDNVTWININATTFSANQQTVYDIPPGQVRMNFASGTTAAIYATLVRVPY